MLLALKMGMENRELRDMSTSRSCEQPLAITNKEEEWASCS